MPRRKTTIDRNPLETLSREATRPMAARTADYGASGGRVFAAWARGTDAVLAAMFEVQNAALAASLDIYGAALAESADLFDQAQQATQALFTGPQKR